MRACLRSMLLVWTAVSVLACSRDPGPGTPAAAAEGERLLRQISNTLASAPAFRFTTDESLEPIGDSRGGRVLRFNRTVIVRRPDAMSFELDGSSDTPIDVSAFYDGRNVSLRDNVHGVWAQESVPGTLDEMLDDVARRFSLPVPIADVVYSNPYEALIGPNTKGGFVGRETIDGVSCAHLAYADDVVAVQVWIPSTGQSLPRRVELVYKQAPGAPAARMNFTNWDLEPAIADEAFTFQPGHANSQLAFEQFVARLLSSGDTVGTATSDTAPGAATPR
jgi:hypothetical protein